MGDSYIQATGIEAIYAAYFTGKTIKCMLLTDAYTYSAAHDFVADVVASEVAGGSYARQTITLAGETIDGSDITEDITGKITFTAVPGNVQFAVYYEFVSDDSDSIILGIKDYGLVESNGQNFEITMASLLKGTIDTRQGTTWTLACSHETTDKSNEDEITVTISRTTTETETVRLNVSGVQVMDSTGGSDIWIDETKGGGENYGAGADLLGSGIWVNDGYLSNYTEITFYTGILSNTVTLTVINNPVFQRTRTVTLTLVTSALTVNSPDTFTLVDDTVPLEVNVVTQYSATGDGTTDDTAAIQAAHDAVFAAGGGVVYFPNTANSYRLGAVFTYKAGVSLIGQSKAGVKIKRFGETWLMANHPAYLDSLGRWQAKMFNAISYSNASDSAIGVVKDITFDGNLEECYYPNMNNCWPTDWPYLDDPHWATHISDGKVPAANYEGTHWEGAHIFYLTAANTGGRHRIRFENVLFDSAPGEAIGTAHNIDIAIYEVEARNCMDWKASYVPVGGNCIHRIKNFDCTGDITSGGIHFETTASTNGYYADSRMDFVAEDCQIKGPIDYTHPCKGTSTVKLRRVVQNKSRRFSYYGGISGNVPTLWAHDTVKAVGNMVRPVELHGKVYRCVAIAGDAKTGAAEPTWDQTIGNQTVDDMVTWECCAFPESKFSVTADDCTFLVENIASGRPKPSNIKSMIANNCIFQAVDYGRAGEPVAGWSPQNTYDSNTEVIYNNCTHMKYPGDYAAVDAFADVPTGLFRTNKAIYNNGTYTGMAFGPSNHGITAYTAYFAGKIEINGGSFDGVTYASKFKVRAKSNVLATGEIVFKGFPVFTNSGSGKLLYIYLNDATYSVAGFYAGFDNWRMPTGILNSIELYNATNKGWFLTIPVTHFAGHAIPGRIIYGTGAPAAGHVQGLVNDRYIDTADSNKAYKCTVATVSVGATVYDGTWVAE